MVMKNPLDILFKDLIRDMEVQKAEAHKKPAAPCQSTYANPLNWKTNRVIELVHQSEGSLGVFQEYLHKSSPSTRRLLPAPKDSIPSTTELVWGEFWLHPKFQAFPELDSEAEIQALTARFHELMEDFFDE